MIKATYFNGKDAKAALVTLQPAPGMLEIRGEELERHEPFSNIRVSSRLGKATRMIYLPDGAHCEISDHEGFNALMRQAGMKPDSMLARIEANWRHAMLATVLFILLVFSLIVWGVPWAADVAARKMPHRLAEKLDADFIDSLDKNTLRPSRLNKATRDRLTDRLQEWQGLDGVQYTLLFRNSPRIGPNAFALPGGTVVVTDQLVRLAADDEEVLAVLAHELGHVAERHPLRQLLQGTVVGLAMTWYFGDISSLLATAPTVLLQTGYSRDFERRADRYAVNLLRENDVEPTKLADMLEKLEGHFRSHGPRKKQPVKPAESKQGTKMDPDASQQQPVAAASQPIATSGASGVNASSSGVADTTTEGNPDAQVKEESADEEEGLAAFVATHPATSERIREIRAAAKQPSGK